MTPTAMLPPTMNAIAAEHLPFSDAVPATERAANPLGKCFVVGHLDPPSFSKISTSPGSVRGSLEPQGAFVGCDDPRMVEYGNAVDQGSKAAGQGSRGAAALIWALAR